MSLTFTEHDCDECAGFGEVYWCPSHGAGCPDAGLSQCELCSGTGKLVCDGNCSVCVEAEEQECLPYVVGVAA